MNENSKMSEPVDFTPLNIPLPEIVKTYSIEKQKEILEYFRDMDENDRKAYQIAFDHLGTSYHICRSNGFKEWKQTKK